MWKCFLDAISGDLEGTFLSGMPLQPVTEGVDHFPPFPMAHYHPTVEEHHYHSDAEDGGSSAVTMIVLLLAVLLIVGFALFAFRAFPFSATGTNRGTDIQVDLNPGPGTTGQGAITE